MTATFDDPINGDSINSDSLGAHARVLLRQPTPWILLPWFAAALTVRMALGGWTWRDPVIVAALVLLQPFVEWILHVGVLHFRPRNLGNRTIDLHLARKHREHHDDPKDIGLTLIPIPELVATVVGVSLGAWFLAIDHRDAATVAATVALLMGIYEWVHFLIHSSYKPKSRHYRSIRRSHRLHHFRNQRYWLGVTSNAADRVLGTFPAPAEVELVDSQRRAGKD
jgi:hypothetical protein